MANSVIYSVYRELYIFILTVSVSVCLYFFFFFFQAEDGIRDLTVTGVQTCALPILRGSGRLHLGRRNVRQELRRDRASDRGSERTLVGRVRAGHSSDQ